MDNFKVIIVEDVLLELKGTEGILRNEVPEAEIIATADSEESFWQAFAKSKPDLVLLDLGLGGSTTVGIDICSRLKSEHPVALRAVTSTDAMTADWAHLPYDFMAKVSNEIINKVKGVNRVCYDISSKPPSTIEWE